MEKRKYITSIDQIPQLSEKDKQQLQAVSKKFTFRSHDYYQSLINWDDPNDPIRRVVIPEAGELEDWGTLDASNESHYTVVPGCEHKYSTTALLLVNDVCGAYCRFCFRKRLFLDENDEVVKDVSQGLEYIRSHTEINNVLLTGGDPLLLSTPRLEKIIESLRAIDHVKIIRIGTKLPAFNPFRITEDSSLLDLFRKHSHADRRIYLMVHFNHPRELTDIARKSLELLMESGAILTNQTPLIRGVNDNPEVLAELLNELSFMGIPPYYVFQCRPTEGNKIYSIPVEASWEIVQKAMVHCSGLARRVRFVMSHESGKIEIVGKTSSMTILKRHSSPSLDQTGELLVFKSNPKAYWFDDYTELIESYAVNEQVTGERTVTEPIQKGHSAFESNGNSSEYTKTRQENFNLTRGGIVGPLTPPSQK